MSFKRATIKLRTRAAQNFTSTFQNGAMVSSWGDAPEPPPIPSGCPGRVGEVVDAMNRGTGFVKHTGVIWVPPISYKFLASKMPKEKADAYIKRCEEWFAERPMAPPKPEKIQVEYDTDMVAKYFSGLTNVPDQSDLFNLWRAAGFSEERLKKSQEWHEKMIAGADDLQARLNAIFGPPEPPTKKVKKVVKKVIKAVKKRA